MSYPILDEEQNFKLLQAIISLRMCVSASTTEALRRGSLKVSQIFFSLRGVPKWRKHKALQIDLMAIISEALSKPVLQSTDIVDSMVESLVLHCPLDGCNRARNVGQRMLYADNKWRTIYCTGCERSSTSKYWKCGCSVA